MAKIFRYPEHINEIYQAVNCIRSIFGKKIVFTNGCFDLLHAGHVYLLQQAKALDNNSFLIVGIDSDRRVRQLKGNTRPIINENERAYMLSKLKPVDMVIIFDSPTVSELIAVIAPDYLVKGRDYTPDNVLGKEFAKQLKLVKSPFETSTTKIINKIESRYKKIMIWVSILYLLLTGIINGLLMYFALK